MRAQLAWSDGKGSEVWCGDGPAHLATLRGVGIVLADPPYAVMQEEAIGKKGGGELRRDCDFDHLTPEDHAALMTALFEASAVAMDAGWAHVFCAHEDLRRMQEQGETAGLHYRGPFVWAKTNPCPRIRSEGLCAAVESAAVFTFGAAKGRDRTTPNHWTGPTCAPTHRIHETQKPTALLRHLIEFYTQPGDLVCDPFAGSCSTLHACQQTGRRCVAIELDPRRVEAAVTQLTEGLPRARALAGAYGAVRGRREAVGQLAFDDEEADRGVA